MRMIDLLESDPVVAVEGVMVPPVMAAYRGWAHWCAKLDGGVYQVKHVTERRDILSREKVLWVLCEVYSRAVFEVALSVHFDGMDSCVDVEVFCQVSDAFGLQTATEVVMKVGEVGPVIVREGERYHGASEHADRANQAVPGEGAEAGGSAAAPGGAEPGVNDPPW